MATELPASARRVGNKIDLEGQTAIVTGGTVGLGLAITERLVASGAHVCVWDIVAPATPLGGTTYIEVDVRSAASVERAYATSRSKGEIDILINNAGVTGPAVPLWEYSTEQWTDVLNIDLVGIFHCCKTVVPAMRARGYGRIVNVSSIAGKEGIANGSAYAAAKAGILGLTKSLARELAGSGVLVNAVTPAAFNTSLWERISPEMLKVALTKIPLGRLGEPHELASLVAWMSSAECSFNTGATFDISGGRATY